MNAKKLVLFAGVAVVVAGGLIYSLGIYPPASMRGAEGAIGKRDVYRAEQPADASVNPGEAPVAMQAIENSQVSQLKEGQLVQMNGQMYQLKAGQLVQLTNGIRFEMNGQMVQMMNGQVHQMNGQIYQLNSVQMVQLTNGMRFQMNGQMAQMMKGQIQMGLRQ